jgi:hypothetical protein
MSQWYTAVAVTRPSLVPLIHFQNTTACANCTDLSFAFVSRLKICRLSPSTPATWAFRAMILLPGFMIALSALMGRFSGAEGAAVSMMTCRAGR